MLKLFSQAGILREIGHVRVAMFLDGFREGLRAAGIVAPTMPDRDCRVPPEPEGTRYFEEVAAIFEDSKPLPKDLLEAARKIEAAALNPERLEASVRSRIPCIGVNRNCPLDCALELWFAVPDELEQFAAQNGEAMEANNGSAAAIQTVVKVEPAEGSNGDGDEQAFCRLARLTRAQYDRVRRTEAATLGIRVETLDVEVARCRARAEEEANGSNVVLTEIEPWPEPVNGAEVLSEVSSRFSLYVILPRGAADAMSLWTEHAHAFQAFHQTPRLNLSSPERECGKTTAMDVLATMTPRPLRTENLTAPVLFRVVDQHNPVLLLDEVDAYLNEAEELRGLLNAGHKRGAQAYRCEGENNGVRSFKAFAPAVLAGIGHLPGTLHDRSIAIPMMKALPGEITVRFEEHRAEAERILGRKLARWAKDNFAALAACDPRLPASAFNRLADNWRPLFAVAEVAGGDWPARALEAFNHLTAQADLDAQGIGVRLLSDIREVFNQSGAERIRSKELVQALCAMTESPWPEAHRGGKPITETWLGHRLRRFGIKSHTMRMGEQVVKGYERADFKDVFARFLKEG